MLDFGFMSVLGIESSSSCLDGQYLTDWAISPASLKILIFLKEEFGRAQP